MMKQKNSSLYRPSALLHRAESERAEFMFKANHHGAYDFLSLLPNGTYDYISQEYETISLPANSIHPWRRRHKWKVGMARDGIHWGVYISRCSTGEDPEDESSSQIEKEGMDVPPVDTYKVYGANWSGRKDQAMHLQAVWSSQGKLKRDLSANELKFVTKRNEGDLFKDALYDQKEMYFSWPEFVLIAQFVLQEWLLNISATTVDTTTLQPRQREDLVQKHNTPAAYSLFFNNCRHFSGQLMERMLQNRWTEKSRLRYDFSFHSLSDEWITLTNIWAARSIPQPRAMSKARNKSEHTRQPTPPTHRSDDLEAIRQKIPRLKRFRWMRLRSQLDRDPDAIDLAISFMNTENLSISDYLKLLRTDATARAVRTIKQEYEDTASLSPPEALIQSWVVVFRNIWEGQNTPFKLLLFLSCTTGHKVQKELLPRSGALRDDIKALKDRGLLEAAEGDYITVRFRIWEIMIFGISVWARCNQGSLPSARRSPGELEDRDLKFVAARRAINHLHSLVTKGASDKEWWLRNEHQIREVLREWQEDHSQDTVETSTVSQFVGQNLVRCGEIEQAIPYLRFTLKFWGAWKDQPANRTTYHFAQLELCRALRHDKLSDPSVTESKLSDSSFAEIKEMLKKNELINKYLSRKGSTKPVVSSWKIWLDEWQYVPELCLELAVVYMRTGKPQKACDILDKLALQFDSDFPLDSNTSSGVPAKMRSLLAKGRGQSKASVRAKDLYEAMQCRLEKINETSDGRSYSTPDSRSPWLSQTTLGR